MPRSVATVVLLATLAVGCSDQLGSTVVECQDPLDRVTNTLILAAQSVPGSDYLPCVELLKPGWDYNDLIAESGRAQFTLDSDRMGPAFLVVTVTETCAIGGALSVASDRLDIDFDVEVLEESSAIPITVIPVAPRHRLYAGKLATTMRDEVFNGRPIDIHVDESNDLMADRVAAAHREGRDVFIVDDDDVKDFTVSVRRVDEDEVAGVDPEDALEDIGEDADAAVYRARWFFNFDGGCIRYEFDAKGIGAGTVAEDATEALGFLDVEPLRQLARDSGYEGIE